MNDMDWTFSLSTPVAISKKNPLRWKKQALYVGAKPVLADGTVREITDDDIDAMLSNGKQRMEMGIKHPLVIADNHNTTDPNHTRGLIDRFEEGVDTKGRRSLYLGGTASTAKDVEVLKSNDISILSPAEDRVAGKVWKRAIKNALVTSYPRVKDLDAFELALSESFKDVPESIDSQGEPEKSFGDYLRRLRRLGMTSRNILKSLERLNSAALTEAIQQIEVPDNRFRGDDYAGIDGTAFALAEEHGAAYLVRDGDDVLVLSEPHPEAYREIPA